MVFATWHSALERKWQKGCLAGRGNSAPFARHEIIAAALPVLVCAATPERPRSDQVTQFPLPRQLSRHLIKIICKGNKGEASALPPSSVPSSQSPRPDPRQKPAEKAINRFLEVEKVSRRSFQEIPTEPGRLGLKRLQTVSLPAFSLLLSFLAVLFFFSFLLFSAAFALKRKLSAKTSSPFRFPLFCHI